MITPTASDALGAAIEFQMPGAFEPMTGEAFQNPNDFREAVLKVVNLGDDADTTGVVCGQLAGGTGVSRGFRPNGVRDRQNVK